MSKGVRDSGYGEMSRRAAVFVDVDNTLYNFVDYFAPAFRAMVHAIARVTMIPEDDIIGSFREVYGRFRSLEYPYSVQKLDVLRNAKPGLDVDEVVHVARVAFGASRRRRLKPYHGVSQTLKWLHSDGYFLTAYTDGPYMGTLWKLRQLGLLRYFNAILAWGPRADELDFSVNDVEEKRWFVPQNATIGELGKRHVSIVQSEHRKPNPGLLRDVIATLDLDVASSWIVGDSIEKDLLPAEGVGIRGVWAKYGKLYDHRNWETLVDVSPWHDSAVRAEAAPRELPASAVSIDDFGDLRAIIPVRQMGLFL